MIWKSFVKDYLTFSRKERIGVLVITIVILFVWLAPQLVTGKASRLSAADSNWIANLLRPVNIPDSPVKASPSRDLDQNDRLPPKAISFFLFDPNKLTAEEWTSLGIREKTVGTIQKYLAHGGRFREPADLKKIYGISPAQFASLEPYIRIAAPLAKAESEPRYVITRHESRSPVDINTADTSAFIALPGIGSKLAARIVGFRERLGGFYSIDQLGETYGLADSNFQKIRTMLTMTVDAVKKININSATKEEMKSHPYIRWNLAGMIVEYRKQHGNFSSLEDLKKISLVTDDLFSKLKPYLTL